MQDFKQEDVYQQAKAWVKQAGVLIRESINQPREVDTKADENDLVTEMDRKIEKFFTDHIRATYPNDRILSEEGYGDDVRDLKGTVWIIDPIDGTMNFVHQKQMFSISLAVYCAGSGEIGFVYDVMADILYHAKKGQGAFKNEQQLDMLKPEKILTQSLLMVNTIWCTKNSRINDEKIRALVQTVRGVRTYGSAALEFAYLAEGIVDCYISVKLHPWDLAAGCILYNEVGGKTLQMTGDALTMVNQEPIIAAHPSIIKQVIDEYLELKN
ncbi:myo-inositol-1(or 4)-monophosphatase [Amphibacillus marinus]|uniref:Myo-inositol-1(Or 4)-monophosphatase n=1 Tax=Amphibacillus marinus TaxID=872970 RepID=A0A1H8I851_9BACI|nr:inositol monophosphatase family protein [Amphibacillus marinus]SEN64559.1 myo-inositol-1(or 4)-monophosphatase [Amphibacillus marinus]